MSCLHCCFCCELFSFLSTCFVIFALSSFIFSNDKWFTFFDWWVPPKNLLLFNFAWPLLFGCPKRRHFDCKLRFLSKFFCFLLSLLCFASLGCIKEISWLQILFSFLCILILISLCCQHWACISFLLHAKTFKLLLFVIVNWAIVEIWGFVVMRSKSSLSIHYSESNFQFISFITALLDWNLLSFFFWMKSHAIHIIMLSIL